MGTGAELLVGGPGGGSLGGMQALGRPGEELTRRAGLALAAGGRGGRWRGRGALGDNG